MSLYGYARVSTLNQDLGIQRAALKAAGYKVIRAEKASGSRRDGRTELQVLLDFVQPGDTLVVTRNDRLARSMKDLQDIVHELKEKGVALRATEQPVDTGTATGKAFLDMLGVFAEFETNLRRERQLEGIKAAKAKGIYKGRKPSIDAAEVRSLRDVEKLGPAAIARQLGIGRASVYRVLEKPTLPKRKTDSPAKLTLRLTARMLGQPLHVAVLGSLFRVAPHRARLPRRCRPPHLIEQHFDKALAAVRQCNRSRGGRPVPPRHVRPDIGHIPVCETARLDRVEVQHDHLGMPAVAFDCLEHFLHRCLRPFQHLSEVALGEQQRPADVQPLIMAPRRLKDGRNLRLDLLLRSYKGTAADIGQAVKGVAH